MGRCSTGTDRLLFAAQYPKLTALFHRIEWMYNKIKYHLSTVRGLSCACWVTCRLSLRS